MPDPRPFLPGGPSVLRQGVGLGLRLCLLGGLVLLAGYLFFHSPWWGLAPLPMAVWIIFKGRWPDRALPFRSALVGAVLAWVPLVVLMWVKRAQVQSVSWAEVEPYLPGYASTLMQWFPLALAAALFSSLALAILAQATLLWRRHPRAGALREVMERSARNCLAIFLILMVARMGWDLALLQSAGG